MTTQDEQYFQSIPVGQFNPASLTGSFQTVFASGFDDPIKIYKMYNGSDVAVDVSYDGVNVHDVLPSGGTLIVDLQANHSCNPLYGSGTLVGRSGQNVWLRTSVHPTYITIGGYR